MVVQMNGIQNVVVFKKGPRVVSSSCDNLSYSKYRGNG